MQKTRHFHQRFLFKVRVFTFLFDAIKLINNNKFRLNLKFRLKKTKLVKVETHSESEIKSSFSKKVFDLFIKKKNSFIFILFYFLNKIQKYSKFKSRKEIYAKFFIEFDNFIKSSL